MRMPPTNRNLFLTRVLSPALASSAALTFSLALGTGCGTSDDKPDEKPTQSNTQANGGDEKKEPDPEDFFLKGVAAIQGEKSDAADFTVAKGEFEKALEKDPGFAIARYNIAVLLEKEGKRDEAKVAYRQAFDADPTLDLAVDNLGILLEAEGDIDAAKELYAEAIEKNKEAVGPRLRLAKIYKDEKDPRQASILAREALQFDAKSADAYRLLAVLYAEAGKNQLARLVAVRGQKLVPDDPELQYALAVVSENERDIAAARVTYGAILEKAPNHSPSRIRLAEMALKNRDWKTATSQLTSLAKTNSQNPDIHNALGLAWKGQGDFQKAKENYEKAMAVDETYAPARFNLGIVYLQHLDQPTEAEKMFSTYLDIGGDEDNTARKLLAETRTVIQALEDEKRMMAEMKAAEEAAAKAAAEEAAAEEARQKEAARLAEEQAKVEAEEAKQAEEAAAQKEPAAAEPPAEAGPEKEAEAPPPKAEEPPPPKKKKTRKKRRRRKPKKKAPEPEKPAGPERDDDFYD